MELAELQKHWNAFGETDPLWAILTSPSKRGGKWDLGEFFESGRQEIQWAVKHAPSLGVPLDRARAIDFGCGVGRLTQALCDHFEHCVGVDIAPSMIEHARRLNRFGARCDYLVNDRDDLSRFDSDTISFIYSNIVLQHIEPKYSRRYIEEFVRVLKPGGVALFQVPSEYLPLVEDPVAAALRLSLTDADFRAAIKPRRHPARVRPGQRFSMKVTLRNLSAAPWPAPDDSNGCEVRLGNHWLDAEGAMVTVDDGRASIPAQVAPGKSVTVTLDLKAPTQLGRYQIELDLVRESISWFKDRGSTTITLPIEVTDTIRQTSDGLIWRVGHRLRQASERLIGPAGRTPGRLAPLRPESTTADPDFAPVMETHGIPRDQVIELVERSGGRIVSVTPNQRTGNNWSSFDYCIMKPVKTD